MFAKSDVEFYKCSNKCSGLTGFSDVGGGCLYFKRISQYNGLEFWFTCVKRHQKWTKMTLFYCWVKQAGDTRIPLPRQSLGHPQKNCRLQSWTLYKSGDCRWISITILCVSFTNSATVSRLTWTSPTLQSADWPISRQYHQPQMRKRVPHPEV